MMTATSYLTVVEECWADIEVSRSRFRCTLSPADNETSARAVIEAVRRQYYDARHHCSAFVIGPDREVQRSSDDGEPAGTGGAPMLEVLAGAGISDVVAVTTRWFGGVLLGTGRLSRAYGESVRAALREAVLRQRVLMERCEVSVDLAVVGRLEHELRARGTQLLGIEYTDVATLGLVVPPTALAVLEETVEELTAGEARLVRRGSEWVDGGVRSPFE